MLVTQKLLNSLWNCYYAMNSQVPLIHQALLDYGEQEIVNDHIAFRTYASSVIGLEQIIKPFQDLGWQLAGEYYFQEKKLRAVHLELESMPKIFVSELLLEQCSESLQQIVSEQLAVLPDIKVNSEFLTSGRWQQQKPDYQIYQQLLAESEYAAWLYVFGICPNHFTVYVNALNKFDGIEALNDFLLARNFVMNTAGGLVKGAKQDGLRQSSTMAAKVEVEFTNNERYEIPCCYYEFAERFTLDGQLFQGFVTASADKIFQSTDSK